MSQRLVLFIDAQNMYKGARETFFGNTGFHTRGQFYSSKLGELIAKKVPIGHEGEARTLTEVRVYSGRADSSRDSKTYGANRRQFAAWEKQGVIVKARTLKYRYDWPNSEPQEKGVDVALAVDFVVMAVEGRYDIGVIASTDTDLLAAIEYVVTKPDIRVEVAAWHNGANKELALPNVHLWCHRMLKVDYDFVADYRDYNIAT